VKAPPVDADARRLRPIADAIARDAPPTDTMRLALQEIRALSGADAVYLLVRPPRLARALGVDLEDDAPGWLEPGIAIVGGGPLGDEIARFEGSTAPLTVGGGARMVLPLPRGGVMLETPQRGIGDDTDKMAMIHLLAGIAAGALHAARRIDENHQRGRALEGARTRLHEQNALLNDLAILDDLTGLHNRRFFQGRLDDEVRRLQRYGRPLSLALFDVDFFKQVNDTKGHATGDAVLKFVAECARKAARKVDLVARIGGDEFAILMPETDVAGAVVVCERLRQLLADDAPPELAVHRITASIGVVGAMRGWQGDTTALLATADQAMYRSKQSGRDRVTAVTNA
jgi:diguanylate cyclase (GGDEF)-like protein